MKKYLYIDRCLFLCIRQKRLSKIEFFHILNISVNGDRVITVSSHAQLLHFQVMFLRSVTLRRFLRQRATAYQLYAV